MAGVYISYPFCAQKCTYCNFASSVYAESDRRRYNVALQDEIVAHQWAWTPETVYWGGGTPSLMPLEAFEQVMSRIPGKPWKEATIECAPGTLDRERISTWLRAGIHRISLGVQSFVPEEARRTGRKHTPESVSADVQLLRDCGITNISIDLIAGLPGQTAGSWQTSLDRLKRLNVPHASIYLFEIDEDSALGKEALLGGIRYGAALLPMPDAAAEFYERAVEQLAESGLARYEISNFAQPGRESLHNLKYWRLEPYAGFGLDAHSFEGRARRANTDDLKTYLSRMEVATSPVIETTETDPEEEHFFVGLRQSSGIEPSEHELLRFHDAVEYGVAAGALEWAGKILRLTPRGVLISNEIFQEFLTAQAH